MARGSYSNRSPLDQARQRPCSVGTLATRCCPPLRPALWTVPGKSGGEGAGGPRVAASAVERAERGRSIGVPATSGGGTPSPPAWVQWRSTTTNQHRPALPRTQPRTGAGLDTLKVVGEAGGARYRVASPGSRIAHGAAIPRVQCDPPRTLAASTVRVGGSTTQSASAGKARWARPPRHEPALVGLGLRGARDRVGMSNGTRIDIIGSGIGTSTSTSTGAGAGAGTGTGHSRGNEPTHRAAARRGAGREGTQEPRTRGWLFHVKQPATPRAHLLGERPVHTDSSATRGEPSKDPSGPRHLIDKTSRALQAHHPLMAGDADPLSGQAHNATPTAHATNPAAAPCEPRTEQARRHELSEPTRSELTQQRTPRAGPRNPLSEDDSTQVNRTTRSAADSRACGPGARGSDPARTKPESQPTPRVSDARPCCPPIPSRASADTLPTTWLRHAHVGRRT